MVIKIKKSNIIRYYVFLFLRWTSAAVVVVVVWSTLHSRTLALRVPLSLRWSRFGFFISYIVSFIAHIFTYMYFFGLKIRFRLYTIYIFLIFRSPISFAWLSEMQKCCLHTHTRARAHENIVDVGVGVSFQFSRSQTCKRAARTIDVPCRCV